MSNTISARGAFCALAIALSLAAGPALRANAGNAANPDAIELAPLPMPVEFRSDMDRPVPFDAATKITVDCPDAKAVDWLNRHLAEWYGANAPRAARGKSGLALREGEEAYAVAADDAGVRIAARSLAGVRWAAYSIRQIAIAKRGTFKTEGRLLPTCAISDAPRLAFRALHLCWIPEMRREQVERAIRLAALLKFNHVILELFGSYRSELHPWWGWPDSTVTKDTIRQLVDVGRDLGVTLIPQVAAYGHAGMGRCAALKHSVLDLRPEYESLFEPGGWNWCLTNPETQRVLRELIVEMLEVFDNPPYIHLGCDEAQPPTCPECRKRPYGELSCEHIANLAAFAKEHGARAMIWHDMLLDREDPRWKGFIACGTKITATLADTLPKDVIICDWQYSGAHAGRIDWPTIAYFRQKGFPVAGCPWMNFDAMMPMADFLAANGGFGYIQTTWHHLRGFDWVRMFRFGASAAWGTPVRGRGQHGASPQFDTEFANVLRLPGHDMKLTDSRDTGTYENQITPSWWLDN